MNDASDAMHAEILDAALRHVPFDGWTRTALERGARDAGRPAAQARIAFPGGPADAIALMSARADARMAATLAAQDLTKLRFRERVAAAVMARLQAQQNARPAVRQALAFLALPGHAGLSARLAWNTAGAIWYAVGDRATDFSFYTKRATLAAVCAATLLVWLDDDSEDLATTRAFLERRIEGVMQFGKLRARVGEAAARLPDPLAILRRWRESTPGAAPQR